MGIVFNFIVYLFTYIFMEGGTKRNELYARLVYFTFV